MPKLLTHPILSLGKAQIWNMLWIMTIYRIVHLVNFMSPLMPLVKASWMNIVEILHLGK